VQVISVERGPSVGATSAFCRRQGRLPVSPPSPTSSSSSSSGSSSSRSRSIVSAVEDATPTVVFAFGDSSMCKPLLSSAKAAGVNVELLKYEKNLGHRQMVRQMILPDNSLECCRFCFNHQYLCMFVVTHEVTVELSRLFVRFVLRMSYA